MSFIPVPEVRKSPPKVPPNHSQNEQKHHFFAKNPNVLSPILEILKAGLFCHQHYPATHALFLSTQNLSLKTQNYYVPLLYHYSFSAAVLCLPFLYPIP
jgi:hypothetical protein